MKTACINTIVLEVNVSLNRQVFIKKKYTVYYNEKNYRKLFSFCTYNRYL